MFRENLCLACQSKATGECRSFFETRIRPVTQEDARLVYVFGKEHTLPLVFKAPVQASDFALCTLLYDEWGTGDDVYVQEWGRFFAREPHRHY